TGVEQKDIHRLLDSRFMRSVSATREMAGSLVGGGRVETFASRSIGSASAQPNYTKMEDEFYGLLQKIKQKNLTDEQAKDAIDDYIKDAQVFLKTLLASLTPTVSDDGGGLEF